MNKEDIERMAREAGAVISKHPEKWDVWEFQDPAVERFAALVAAAEQDRCCKIIYSMAGSDNVAQRTVDAIRGNP